MMKVDGEPLLVQALRRHGDRHAPVMAVEFFALALIAAQLMGCGEFGFDHKLIHSVG